MSGDRFRFRTNSVDEGPDWFGEVLEPQKPGDYFKFDLARTMDDFRVMMAAREAGTNFDSTIINGYWGLTQKAALFEARQSNSNDLELLQIGKDRRRQLHRGDFSYILHGNWLLPGNGPYYKSMTASYDGLDAALNHKYDFSADVSNSLEIASYCPAEGVELHISEVGIETLGHRSRSHKRRLELRMLLGHDFNVLPCTLWHASLCRLFDLLAGNCYAPAKAALSKEPAKTFGCDEIRISGHFFLKGQRSFSCFCELNVSSVFRAMETLLSATKHYLVQEQETIFRCHFEDQYLEDRLYWGLPVLEKQLKRKFRSSEELSYIELEENFFEKIGTLFEPDLKEFVKKHVQIKKRKTRGFKPLLEDAVDYFVAEGFPLSVTLPSDINLVRQQLIHGVLDERKLSMPLSRVEGEIRFLYIALHFLDLEIPVEQMNGLKRYFFSKQLPSSQS